MAKTSPVHDLAVYGRDDDKEAIMNWLLQSEEANEKDPDVISIVGMDGIGKTTLAHFLYSDNSIMKHFDHHAWVHVSEGFDILKVIKDIFKELTSGSINNTQISGTQLLLDIKIFLMGKRFLIVLDDVLSDNLADWNFLLTHLKCGSKGSKILITTRSTTVAKAADATKIYHLEGLNDDDCWFLFSNFGIDGNFDPNPHFMEIGSELLMLWEGVPLYVKALGGLLYLEKGIRDWRRLLENLIDDQSTNNSLLQFCFDLLPPHLQQCFACCAILPKNSEFRKEEVIELWMKEGMVKHVLHKNIEETSNEHFDELVKRTFFQRSRFNPSCFSLHPLYHDLASYASTKLFQQPTVGRDLQIQSIERKTTEVWIFTLTNVVLEILVLIFDQISSTQKPQYGMFALIVSLMAIAICVTELIYKGHKLKIRLNWEEGKRWGIQYSSSSSKNPYSYIDVFSLVTAISQVILSTYTYSCLHRGKQSPIKLSFASLIFLVCLAASKIFNKPNTTNVSSV